MVREGGLTPHLAGKGRAGERQEGKGAVALRHCAGKGRMRGPILFWGGSGEGSQGGGGIENM